MEGKASALQTPQNVHLRENLNHGFHGFTRISRFCIRASRKYGMKSVFKKFREFLVRRSCKRTDLTARTQRAQRCPQSQDLSRAAFGPRLELRSRPTDGSMGSLRSRWRRGWGSNPRCLAAFRFSRPAHSTTLPPLL